MNILEEFLQKVGKRYDQLSPQAKATYDNWSNVFQKEITVKDIKELFIKERESAINVLKSPEIEHNSQLDVHYKEYLRLLDITIKFIDSPEIAKSELKSHIKRIHKIKEW